MLFKFIGQHLMRRSKFAVPRVGKYSTHATQQSGCKSSLGVIGVPFSKGQPKSGVESAPDMLRENGLVNMLTDISNGNLTIKDYGNLKYTADPDSMHDIPNMKNVGEIMGCNKALIKRMQETLQENDQTLMIGGDHSLGFGSVAGHLLHTPNLALVWIDAHADVNLPQVSPSGNAHGMPVALLLKELRQFWKTSCVEQIAPVCIPCSQVFYIGLRSVDPYEAYLIEKLGIRAYAMDSIDHLGIDKVIEKTLDAIGPQNKIHISFDIDSLDARIAPSTGTPVEGGLTLREGVTIMEALRDTKRVEAIDLTEVNLSLGTTTDANATISAGFEILKAFFGQKRHGNSEHIDKDIFL